MKFLVVAALFGIAVAAPQSSNSQLNTEWNEWKAKYNKVFNQTEDDYRKSIFAANLANITAHNYKYQLGLVQYDVAVNAFADLTSEEFVSIFNGYAQKAQKQSADLFDKKECSLPKSVDWRKKGVVTPVKNQGQCGSCWAFSATGSLEGQHALKNNKLVSLSEQNLVDCSFPEGDMGCNGGLMDNAFLYVKKNKGIDTESSYPYKAVDGNCKYNGNDIGATVTGSKDIPSGDEDALQCAIASVGPISVAIDASQVSFQFYSSGVYYEPECSSQLLDHGVLAVGFGVESGKDYYIVKNSWGEDWGMNGYIYMSRNKDNNCGIATSASYPLV